MVERWGSPWQPRFRSSRDVMRVGRPPHPTKSEQSDLNIAVHGCTRRAALVLAHIGRGLPRHQRWAVQLRRDAAVPAIVLTDIPRPGAFGRDRPAPIAAGDGRVVAAAATTATPLRRHAGRVSPMAIPGAAGLAYTATSRARERARLVAGG